MHAIESWIGLYVGKADTAEQAVGRVIAELAREDLAPRCGARATRGRDRLLRPQARRGKRHNAAILCLARRRCDLIFRMLTTGLTYGELPAGKTGTFNPEPVLTNP